jgi:hypothetical protein
VKIHFPSSQYGTASARYEVFVLDFQEEPIGEADLGSPVLTAEIDQSGRTTYSEFTDGEGFITVGSIDVNVPESPGVSTVVIKLSIPEEERSRSSAGSELLISDAVSLERID